MSFEEPFGPPGRDLDARSLKLSYRGEPVAFHLDPGRGTFSRGSALYFVSEGARRNPYGLEAVYELEVATGGIRIPLSSATPSRLETSYYWPRLVKEETRYYQAGLLEAEDLWLGDVLFAPARKSYRFDLKDLASTAEAGRLVVKLQGASDFPVPVDHHVRCYLNGTLVGEASWDGKKPRAIEAGISPGLIQEGANQLEIENVGDTEAAYSMVLLDRFELSYPRSLAAEGGKLEGAFSQGGTAAVRGLAPGAHVLDTTEAPAQWLVGAESSGGALRFRTEARHNYLAVSPEAVLKPEVRKPSSSSSLRSPHNRADYLLLAPRAFLEACRPLLELRRSQGLRSLAVAVEELYLEFGFGESRPEAIRDFLAFAYHHWKQPPRYVLLLGDATYDFKGYLGTGVTNQVPARSWSRPLWTASDPAYAAVNGEDVLPDLAIGRLPAATVEEARAMVEKILTYETARMGSEGPVVLVADNPDEAGDFEADLEEIAAGLLASRHPRKIYLGKLGTTATRAAVAEAFDRGSSLTSYVGHGGIQLWAHENIFNTSQVASLAPQPRQPVLLTLNCLNGYFHFPYFNSLAEELLKAEGKGVIASVSPSGLSLNGPAHVFHQALLREISLKPHLRLGDAVMAAQGAYADSGVFPEMLSIHHLFGDPALRLR